MKKEILVNNYKKNGHTIIETNGKFYTICDTCQSSMAVTTHYNQKGLCSTCFKHSN